VATVFSKHDVRGRTIWRVVERFNVVLYLLALLIVFGILQPSAFTAGSAATVVQLSVPLLVVATGMTFCLLCGEVDLSVAGIAGLASTLVALKMDHGMAWPFAIALALLAGTAVGMVNGVLTAWLASSFPKFPSFLVTLSMLSVTAGAAETLQPMQQAIAIGNSGFQHVFGYTSSVLVSPPIWYAVIVVVIAHLILTKSTFGYALHAVGSSSRAARFVGFNVVRTKFWVLAVSGFLAAVGGILMAGFVQAGFFGVAKGIEVDAIAAAVIGGTALFGGRGTVLGTVGGVLILGVLNTGLMIMQAPVNIQLVTKGCVVVLALAVGEYIRLRSARV
jgi:ribose transport system permease protein